MSNVNIERALLATFLWCNDLFLCTDDAFELNVSVFTSEDRRAIASKINEVTATKDRFYGVLNLEIQNTVQQEWMDIVYYTPLPFKSAEKYYKKLLLDYKNKLMVA